MSPTSLWSTTFQFDLQVNSSLEQNKLNPSEAVPSSIGHVAVVLCLLFAETDRLTDNLELLPQSRFESLFKMRLKWSCLPYQFITFSVALISCHQAVLTLRMSNFRVCTATSMYSRPARWRHFLSFRNTRPLALSHCFGSKLCGKHVCEKQFSIPLSWQLLDLCRYNS